MSEIIEVEASTTPDSPRVQISPQSVAEREAHGKAARARAPRSSHATWEPPASRLDPIDLLEEQSKTRLAELVPIRYGRMLASPFAFLRGAAAIMASDLAGMPRTGLDVQLGGDAHLANFGVFAAPDRHLVFDINDFDETSHGPFEWDLRRLVVSFAVAGRGRRFDAGTRRAISCTISRSYRQSMASFAGERNFDIWYSRIDLDDFMSSMTPQLTQKAVKRSNLDISKAAAKDNLSAFEKLTHMVNGEPRIVSSPPLIVPFRELGSGKLMLETAHKVLQSYRRTLTGDRRHLLEGFRFVDAALKVVGVGSVGTRCWIMLFLGRDNDDPLFLQVKEAESSVLEPFLGKSRFATHGQRVVEGQRLMQAASDIMLGWIKAEGLDGIERDYYIRQLWDSKESAQVEVMSSKAMSAYARMCGSALARAHARSGDPIAIARYLGTSDRFGNALATFAETYADQNQRDFDALAAAARAKRIVVQRGV